MQKTHEKNSFLVLTTPNPYSFFRIISKILKKEVPNFEYHTTMFDSVTLSNIARENGFKIEKWLYCNTKKPKSIIYRINNTISKLFPKFSSGYIFILKKQSK